VTTDEGVAAGYKRKIAPRTLTPADGAQVNGKEASTES